MPFSIRPWPQGAESVCTLVAQKPTTGRMKSFPQSPRLPRLKSHHELIPLISVSLHRGREEEGQKHCTEHKTQSALSRIIKAGYAALLLEYFFTTGPDEVRAWTVRKGTKAPQAAEKIHTDFEKGFIMAEVMKFQDFKEEGSENAVKAAGKYRQRGRNYEDGDIIFFKFNTPNAQKKK
ncbi:hypothetical protein CesoFtcFv8_013826 [Champsocephalus esox]|uniref:TGS domain-containing protein n=1 Tax=Champsocephalus esox TaxID=159716 RepID=A0AAN8BSG0_9TELE|nr:hypothetical protein CesoFtcFv8_013826 [Champsocephalus esox]